MRAIWITKHGGPDVLEVRETATPEPEAGQVRVAVQFAGLNFAELSARQGLYPDAPKPPCVVGYEGAGTIDALGSDVTGLAVGDRVAYMCRFGGHASHVVTTADQVVKIPEAMTFEHAAAMPVNYLTAHHMLFELARIRPGAHVLVHMAAGGVGTAALQLCRTLPDVVTYGTASASKHDYVRTHGCTHAIDYRTKDYVAEVMRLTNGRGVDVVLDALGGGDWRKGYTLLRPAGMLVAFGLANTNSGGRRSIFNVLKQLVRIPRFSPLRLMDDNRAVAGCNMGHLWGEKELLRRQLDALVKLYEDGAIRPHVHAIHSFEHAREAFDDLALGRNTGKVLLRP
jgi:synaptic vesicle membrane protein VAT-1